MSQRVQPCSKEQAATRLAHARAYLDVAELVSADDSDDALRGVAAGVAVLAGIAASDAACCHALGRRSRGASHKDAVGVLASIGGDDAKAASNALRRLIDLKDKAHYGFTNVSAADRSAALVSARRVLDFAEQTLL